MLSGDLKQAVPGSPGLVEGPRSVVLAIDGDVESDNAVACASRLAEMMGARIHVVSVAEPVPPYTQVAPYFSGLAASAPVVPDSDRLKAAQLARVREQLSRITSNEWRVSMRSGFMGTEVADFATSVNADIIVAGRGRHGLVDRLLGEEHLVRLLRVMRVPLLAVEPTFTLPAKRVVLAVDFSEHNLTNARAALPYLADDATVYLVHVKPDPPFGIPHPGQWIRSYEDGVRAGLRSLQSEIAFPPLAVVEPIVLNGHPGVALAEFARASRSDLTIIGSQGAGFLNRLVIGSVTTYLLRAANCSLFVVPRA